MAKKIILIDDHKVIHSALELFFSSHNTFELVSTFIDFNSAQETLFNTSFDILLLDINLGQSSGFDLIPSILKRNEGVKIIVFSANDTPEFINAAYEAGASGFFSKSRPLEELPDYLSLENKHRLKSSGLILGQLTQKEQEVMYQLYKGKSYKVIADDLCVSRKTIEAHQSKIFKKLQVKSRVELIHFMNKSGLAIKY